MTYAARETSNDTLASTAVIEAIADREGVDPTELETPLYDAVDPDALDALFSPGGDDRSVDGRIAFTYCGYEVVLQSSGDVTVTPTVDPSRKMSRA